MTGQLHAVRHPSEVTAAEALAWFAQRQSDRSAIGYLLAPDRAEWFRCQASVPHGPRETSDLTTTFEVFATDGSRQLRWLHGAGGTGQAISITEDPSLLPGGTAVTAKFMPTRLEGVATRLLAGLVTQSHDGWARVTSARYAPYEVPVTVRPGQEIWADLAEYTVCDEHGNLSVVDTLLLGLHARDTRTRTATTERHA